MIITEVITSMEVEETITDIEIQQVHHTERKAVVVEAVLQAQKEAG